MEFLKDLVRFLGEGIVEWWAECNISSKRQEHFMNEKSKFARVCYYGTIVIEIVLVGIGIMEFIWKKFLKGIICLATSAGVGMWICIERGTSKE